MSSKEDKENILSMFLDRIIKTKRLSCKSLDFKLMR